MARKLIVEIIGDSSSLEKSFRDTSHGAKTFERDIGKTTRGVIAGSGAFQGLGRSIAFASGYFIGGVGITALLTKSVEAATDAQAAQRQLAAQFKAAGQNLGDYRSQIDNATLAVSELAGFNETELTQSFTTAFRGSQKVAVALKIQSVAADAARGTHKELGIVTTALTKAYLGQATALKRLGIIVPANVEGMAALEFVQRRFAGQAEAGTTAQQRFHAALHNTEVVIGSAVLPTLTKYLNKVSKWLNDTDHQRQIQKATNGTLKVTGALLGIAVHATEGWALAIGKLQKAGALIPKPLIELLKAFGGGGVPGLSGPVGTTGASAAGLGPGLRGPTNVPPSVRTGLHAQFLRSQLALAQAQVTATNADDRTILAQEAKITRAAISQTSNLKKRTDLYQRLGSIENQIRAIDAQRASAKKDRQEKERAAREKELAADKASYAKTKAQADKLLEQFKARAKAQREALASAASAVRQQLGSIFQGPVFNAPAGVLGISNARAVGGTIGAGGFVSNVRQQTAQLVAFNNDLARLARRGAPGGLISQLRQGGLEQAPLIHQLATAGRPTLRSLFRAFAQQEKVVQQIAHADVQAKTVTIVTGHLGTSATTPASQRRGRQAGVPSTIGSFINP